MSHEIQRLRIEDCLSFLDQVRQTFSDESQVYNKFLDIMEDFRCHRIDVPDVIQRAAVLFQGHPELNAGFSAFLPLENTEARNASSGSVIMPGKPPTVVPVCPPQDYKQDNLSLAEVQFRKNEAYCATVFQKEVERDFRNQHKVHHEFLDTMQNSYHQSIESTEALEFVGHRFQENPEIIANFNEFLPPEYRIKVHPNKEIEVISPKRDSEGDIFIDSKIVQDKQPSITIYLPNNFASNQLSHEMQNSLPEYSVKYVYGSQLPELQQQQSKEDEDSCFKLVESAVDNLVYHNFLDIVKELRSQRIDVLNAIYRVLSLFRGHLNLTENLNAFLPPGYRVEVRLNDLSNITAENS